MSKEAIEHSLETINKKLNLLVKRECDGGTDSENEEEEDHREKGPELPTPKRTRSAFVFFCQEERAKLKKSNQILHSVN